MQFHRNRQLQVTYVQNFYKKLTELNSFDLQAHITESVAWQLINNRLPLAFKPVKMMEGFPSLLKIFNDGIYSVNTTLDWRWNEDLYK